MQKLLSADLWDTIGEKAANARRRRAAIAYVTESRLLPLGAGDVLVVDASDDSIAGGRTCAKSLAGYFAAGVSLFNVPNLHAKVLVLDDCSIIGSANASMHSAEHYVEASVISDHPELVSQAEQLIGLLAVRGNVIDSEFIARIQKIPVKTRPPVPSNRSPVKIQPSAPRCWFVSTREDAVYPGNSNTVESALEEVQGHIGPDAGFVSWFWWGGSARFPSTARVGDIVIQCSRPRNKMLSSRGVLVYRHARIERIFQEPGQTAKTFHCVRALDWQNTTVKWGDFTRLAKRAGVTRQLSYTSNVTLTDQQSAALFAIWPT